MPPPVVSDIQFSFDTKAAANADRSFQYLLIKLLIGSCSITYRGQKLTTKSNWAYLPMRPQTLRGRAAFSNFCTQYNISLSEQEFIRVTTLSNREFYQDLLTEFCHFFLQTKRSSNVSAFVVLYRILERMSYSVPLLYCKRSNDYYGTFDELKTVFTNIEKAGELGFLKKFLNQGRFIDSTILDITYTLDFSTFNDKNQFFNTMNSRFKGLFDTADAANHQLTIKYRNMPAFITNIRNRFFHLRTGDSQANLSIRQLGNPEDFFQEINKASMSFLAILALHAIAVP